jgi:predicted MFS family arabinose efflux permease
MMAARTAATQMGYLLGSLIGGATLAMGGYAALGVVLSTGLILGATLVLRVTDQPPASETLRPKAVVNEIGAPLRVCFYA